MSTTIKTTIHTYLFDTRKASEKAKYEALCSRLGQKGLECAKVIGFDGSKQHRQTVELEIYARNRWQTVPTETRGCEVLYEWAEEITACNSLIKRGRYLSQTPAMKAVQQNTYACGKCGKHGDPDSDVFCTHCRNYKYLFSKDLYQTRLMPLLGHQSRAQLTTAEREYLLPLYRMAQTKGGDDCIWGLAKHRERLERKEKEVRDARVECDGFAWLVEKGINTNGVYYLDHTERFCFRYPDTELIGALSFLLAEFPYPCDILREDDQTIALNTGSHTTQYLWSSSDGTLHLALTARQIDTAAHSGSCDEGVASVVKEVQGQLDLMTLEAMRHTMVLAGIEDVGNMPSAMVTAYIVWTAAWDLK